MNCSEKSTTCQLEIRIQENQLLEQLQVRKLAITLEQSYFRTTWPYPVWDSCGYFYYICCKQKEADLLDFEDVVLPSLHSIWHNGWAEQDDRCQRTISRLLSHGSCDASLKWPVPCLSPSLCPPPLPPLSLLEPPLAGRTLSPGWSGSCWDWRRREEWMDGWREGGREGAREQGRGLHRPEEHCQQPPTSPITLHPILPSYPLSLLTLPHIQTDSPPALCVYMCLCTCHLSPYRLLWWMHVLEKKKGDGALFFMIRACLCGCVWKIFSEYGMCGWEYKQMTEWVNMSQKEINPMSWNSEGRH